MAASLNAVYLIGRTGRDPEMRYAGSGKPYTTFSVATDRRSKAEGQTDPDWHRVVCWDKLAEFANQYVSKGRLVFVRGRLSYRAWTGQDGQQRHTTEIVAGDITLLDRRPTAEAPEANQTVPADDDDLPF